MGRKLLEQRRLGKKKAKRGEDGELICGMPRGVVMLLLVLLVLTGPAFLYLDYFLMKYGM